MGIWEMGTLQIHLFKAFTSETSKMNSNNTQWKKIFDRSYSDAANNTYNRLNQNNLRGQHGFYYYEY